MMQKTRSGIFLEVSLRGAQAGVRSCHCSTELMVTELLSRHPLPTNIPFLLPLNCVSSCLHTGNCVPSSFIFSSVSASVGPASVNVRDPGGALHEIELRDAHQKRASPWLDALIMRHLIAHVIKLATGCNCRRVAHPPPPSWQTLLSSQSPLQQAEESFFIC